jgi:hypothetical protein
MHTWLNKGKVPAVMAAILIDATPVEAGGKVLHTTLPRLIAAQQLALFVFGGETAALGLRHDRRSGWVFVQRCDNGFIIEAA